MGPMEVASRAFRWGAAVRHRRLFHPAGVVATGRLERVAPVGEGLPLPSCAAVIRISKGGGTPGAVPDAVGLAVRVPAHDDHDAHACWDILMVSAGSGVLSRALVIRPALSWSGVVMTTLMPLHFQGDYWWLRARLTTRIGARGLALSSIRTRIGADQICFEVDQARGSGEFRPVARLVVDGLDTGRDVSFDPTNNTSPGVELRPRWLADLRAHSYRGSRQGRGAARVTRSAESPQDV